ncbi:MAG: terminase TerL endonuclease subunit [Syntrophomonas sp.]
MPNIDRTTKYAKEVLAGNIVAGELVKKACRRHMDDLKNSKKKSFEFCFDQEYADRAIDFFQFLHHSKGKWANQTIKLELWQCFIVGNIFGWRHKKTKLRRYRTAYQSVARKNGKSTMMGGIGLYGLLADGEPGAEVYSAATKKDQARIIFDEAKRMVKASPYMAKHVDVFTKNMSVPVTNSKFEPLSADVNSMDGLNISMGLIDELHAHKTREMWDVLETATGAREQPLIAAITTAGFNRFGICYEQYNYCINILNGTVHDDTYFCYIAQIDKEDDWRDPACWIKANPNLNISVFADDLKRKCEKAKEIPAAQNNFICKHLNCWVSQTVRWMPMDKWFACPTVKVDLTGLPCYLGGDLSATTDICSINAEFPLDDGRYYMLSHSFMPEDLVDEKEKRDNVPYRAWESEGFITFTPGSVVDYEWIKSYVLHACEIYDVQEFDYDPWNATQLANDLANEGIETVQIRQGYGTLSEPTKDILGLTLQKKIIHNDNPLLAWAVGNAAATSDPAGNIKLDKSKTTFRIDPAAAMVTSHVRARLHAENHPKPGIILL